MQWAWLRSDALLARVMFTTHNVSSEARFLFTQLSPSHLPVSHTGYVVRTISEDFVSKNAIAWNEDASIEVFKITKVEGIPRVSLGGLHLL